MRKSAFIMLLISAITAGADQLDSLPVNSPLLLKDGSYIFIYDDDTMRMVDKTGNPVRMQDGVEMELKEGTLIMMKNKKIWRHIHREKK